MKKFLVLLVLLAFAPALPAQEVRGLELPADKITAFSARKGDVVDVLLSFEKNNEKQVATLFQRREILEVKAASVVIKTDQDDAFFINFLNENQGVIKIIFRNKNDAALVPLEIATFKSLFS